MRRFLLNCVFLLTLFVLSLVFSNSNKVMAATEPADPESLPIRVMLVIYDPIIESGGGVRLHDYYTTWDDPVVLSNNIVNDFYAESHGKAQFQIVDTQIRDEWPLHTNGQRYTDSTYLQAVASQSFTLGPGNYNQIISDLGIQTKIANGEIDEVWLWGGPGFGWWEATTAGDGAYSTNGGPVTGVTGKMFSIMGLNYEREEDEALESFGHRLEGTMKHMYETWAFGYGPPPAQAPAVLHPWDQFTVKNYDPGSLIGCGFAHGSMNTPTYDQTNNYWSYDWTNTTTVNSTCDNWYSYPFLSSATTSMNCNAWGCNNYDFLKWWYDHVPYVAGTYDSYLANWWRYFVDNDQYKSKLSIEQLAVGTDYAESNSSSWSCWADQSTCSLSNDTTTKKFGASSVKMTTSGAFDNYMKYPSAGNANWNLDTMGSLSFWAYATNTNQSGFQGSIVVHLKDSSGNGYTYTSPSDYWDMANGSWHKFTIPFGGNSTWTRTTVGSPGTTWFSDVDYVEIHSDTYGAGFTLALDGLGFITDYSERSIFSYPTTYYNWDGFIDGGGSFLELHGLTGATDGTRIDGERVIQYYTDADLGVHAYYGSWNGLPGQGPLNYNATNKTLVFWAYSDNPNSGKFENSSPTIRLRTGTYNGSSYYTYTPPSNLLNSAIGRWQRFEIPVAGNSTWTRTTTGSPSLSDVDWIEMLYDTTGTSSYSVYFDGVRFESNDTTSPTASITSPSNGANVSGTVTVNVSSTDETATRRVDLLVDGNFVQTDAIAPFTFYWNTTSTTSGTHSLTAKAYDMAGNVTTSSAVSVNVSITSPTVFADGFEAGNTSAWTSEVDAENDLTVTSGSALKGSWGVAALIDNTTDMYVQDTTPNAEKRYRSRFYFDPNSITMASGDTFSIFSGRMSSGSAFHVQLNYSSSSGYRIRTQIYDDTGTAINGPWISIADASHYTEIDWMSAAVSGSLDGYITLWIDGSQASTQTGIDNDTRLVDEIRLGAVANIDAGTSGTVYFDSSESNRYNYIGGEGTGSDNIFEDGFESGNTSSWSSEVDAENDLSVTTGSALNSTTYGLAALIDNTTDMYVSDVSPVSESRYRARFYLDPNSITMASADTFNVFAGREVGGTAVNVQLNYSSTSGYRVRTAYYDDAANQQGGTYYNITDAPHYIEIDWKASSAAGANDGYVSLWIDGVLQGTQSGADNDTKRVDEARLGGVGNIDAGTSGTIFIDSFKSTKTGYIGP